MNSSRILDIVFPPRCAICDDVIGAGQGNICKSCKYKLIKIEEPVCFKCGKELEYETEEYCSDCSSKTRSFIKGFPVYKYVSPLSDSLMRLKYGSRQEYALFFGNSIVESFGETFKRLKPDALVPVPINKKKYTTRGYNQAALIAKAVSRSIGVPVREDILSRRLDTAPQKELSAEERERNLRSAFEPGKGSIDGLKTVMLVDDIYTSGATIEACTMVCKSMGIKNVYYTSVAIGDGN